MKTGTMLFEPGVGGRLLQKSASGDEYELGSILKWEPGRTLEFEWRLDNFEDDQLTVVKVDFSKIASSTRIYIEHSGWDSLPADHAARHGKTSVAFISLRTAWWDSLLLAYRDSDLMKTKA